MGGPAAAWYPSPHCSSLLFKYVYASPPKRGSAQVEDAFIGVLNEGVERLKQLGLRIISRRVMTDPLVAKNKAVLSVWLSACIRFLADTPDHAGREVLLDGVSRRGRCA